MLIERFPLSRSESVFGFVLNVGAGHMSETMEWARTYPLVPAVTQRPWFSMKSSTLWAFTTNNLALTEMTTSKSGGTRSKKVSLIFFCYGQFESEG